MSLTQRLIFLAVVTVISLGMHLFVSRSFLLPARISDSTKKRIRLAVILHAVALPWLFQLMAFTGQPWADALQAVGWLDVGVLSLLFIFMVAKAFVWRFAVIAMDRAGGRGVDHSRRDALSRMLNGGVALAAGGITAAGNVQARRTAAVETVEVPITGLPPSLEGFKIAQISDLHVGPTIRRDEMAAVAEKVNALNPDLIAVTGDLVDGPVSTLASMVAPLAGMKARHGTWFITGNHEYYSGVESWCRHCSEGLGWHVLLNEHRLVEHDGARVVVAGVTDLSAGRVHPPHAPDLPRACDAMPTADVRILLAHQPARAQEAADAGFDLQLSGHTHGGQYFPFTVLIRLAQRFVVGLHQVGRMWLYVNPGTTYWGPPIRLGMAQEITLLKLTRSKEAL